MISTCINIRMVKLPRYVCVGQRNRHTIKNTFVVISGWSGPPTRRPGRFFDGGKWLFGDVRLPGPAAERGGAHAAIEGRCSGIRGAIFESPLLPSPGQPSLTHIAVDNDSRYNNDQSHSKDGSHNVNDLSFRDDGVVMVALTTVARSLVTVVGI